MHSQCRFRFHAQNSISCKDSPPLGNSHHGHVKLLTRLDFPVPRISPRSCFGTRALAQHCSATRLIRSISSSLSLSCLFASLLFRNLTPCSSTCVAFAKGRYGYVCARFCRACVGRSVIGEETRLSRLMHSAMTDWMPAESWVARDRR